MKRREFVAASCLAGLAPFGHAALANAAAPSKKEYYELRVFKFASKEKRDAFTQFLAAAAVPALNRLGISPIGVFEVMEGENPKLAEEDQNNLYCLGTHKSLESAVGVNNKLIADEAFISAGAEVLGATKDDPAYTRFESSLLLAFDGMPKLEVPTKKKSRLFQLRIYESHSVHMGQRKIEMFNKGGEIDVFRDTGLLPVFFGEALIGSKLPNLTYMIAADDMDASKAAWAAFRAHPDWQKLKDDEYYKDTVSNITNIYLRPAACSQI